LLERVFQVLERNQKNKRRNPRHSRRSRAKTVLQKIEKSITQANIEIGHIGISRENPDYYAVMIMNYILGGGGFSARLMDNIRDNRGLAYDVTAFFPPHKEPGAFFRVHSNQERVGERSDRRDAQGNPKMQSELVSEKELADAKAYLTGSFPLKMDYLCQDSQYLTSVEIYGLGLDYPQKYPGLINSVTAVRTYSGWRRSIFIPTPWRSWWSRPEKGEAEILMILTTDEHGWTRIKITSNGQ